MVEWDGCKDTREDSSFTCLGPSPGYFKYVCVESSKGSEGNKPPRPPGCSEMTMCFQLASGVDDWEGRDRPYRLEWR